ncbi:MAG TPA: thioredoxin domain-containing protein [Terriglobales bacterium]|nr:thioredoxin domain-containing protein [Terriglobales bacterium]
MSLRPRAVSVFATAFLLLSAISSFAQGPAARPNRERTLALRPPTGAKVAIIVFEDLQCPDCARAAPLLKQAGEQHKVPVVHRDFPLPMHNFAFEAAVIARYFDTKSPKLGEGWRDYVFQNQQTLTPGNIQQMAAKYAKANGSAMPFLMDPGKKLEAKVRADVALGKKIGIQHTPTIFVVNNSTKMAEPFVEVVDRAQLSQIIQQMKSSAK